MTYPHGWDAIAKFYGYKAGVSLESKTVVVPAPNGFAFTYDGKPSRGIRVHHLIAMDFAQILHEVAAAGLWRYVSAHSGGFAIRMQRGSAAKVSLHSLGAAVDFDAPNNPLGVPPSQTRLGSGDGLKVVAIFEAHGWEWGGNWHRPDSMHVQAATGF